jgi:phage baseplate assembly protein W
MATVETTTVRNFKDLDLNFNIHPVRKDINMHKNEYAIINAVKNLVLTNFYERPFQPELGSNVRRLLFENVDNLMSARVEKAIEETILNFEPRVQISKIVAVPDADRNAYGITLEFFIINNANPITITFFLERIR